MFKQIDIQEELLLAKTMKLCLVSFNPEIKSDYNCGVYFYCDNRFKDGMTIFKCAHVLTKNSFILDLIELDKKSVDLYDLDEQVIYSLIPLLIRFSVELAVLSKKNKVILKSSLCHFADHLVDNGFNICKRIIRNSENKSFSIAIKGTKNIKFGGNEYGCC